MNLDTRRERGRYENGILGRYEGKGEKNGYLKKEQSKWKMERQSKYRGRGWRGNKGEEDRKEGKKKGKEMECDEADGKAKS